MNNRKPAGERRVVGNAVYLIKHLQHQYPSNPTDLRRLVDFAHRSRQVNTVLLGALGEIMAGPHADYDYIKSALEVLQEEIDTLYPED